MTEAFSNCEAVAHCAGINCERGNQTYEAVHVEGTKNVINAAKRAGVKKNVLLSFLKARPDCNSAYHESKWEAEELVRESGLDYTILKPGMIYGLGDHMLDHLSHLLHTIPIFAKVGLKEKPIRPIAIQDLVTIIDASLCKNQLHCVTTGILGPEELMLSEAVQRVAQLLGRKVITFPLPIVFHYSMALILEKLMKISLLATAQLKMLAEGMESIDPQWDNLPKELQPNLPFSGPHIELGLPTPKSFSCRDLRVHSS